MGLLKAGIYVLTLGSTTEKRHRPYNDSAVFSALCLELVENRSLKLEAAQREEAGKKFKSQPVWGAERGDGRSRLQDKSSFSLGAKGQPGASAVLCQETTGEWKKRGFSELMHGLQGTVKISAV